MKKILSILLTIGMITTSILTPAYAEEEIDYVKILNDAIDFQKEPKPVYTEYDYLDCTDYEKAFKSYETGYNSFINNFKVLFPDNKIPEGKITENDITDTQKEILKEFFKPDSSDDPVQNIYFSELESMKKTYLAEKNKLDETKILIVENNGALINEYKDGKLNFNFDIERASNNVPISLKNDLGSNYVPFRYLLEKIAGFSDATDIANPSKSHEALYDKIKEIKTPSFIWENIYGIFHLYITDGENYYYGKKDEVLKTKDQNEKHIEVSAPNGTPCKVKIINGSCYIPLRALELFGLKVEYYSDTELIIIVSDKHNKLKEGAADEINESYKKIFNNNYYFYSSLYDENNNKISNAYCVNKYGNHLFYVDSESFTIFTATTEKLEGKKLKIYENETSTEAIKDFYTDMITFSGNKLYGIRTNKAGNYNGKLFSVLISVNEAGELIGTDYKEYTTSDNYRGLIFTREGTESTSTLFLYTIDNADSEQIKRINISANPDENNQYPIEKITDIGTPVSDFNVNGEYLLHTDRKALYIKKIINNSESYPTTFQTLEPVTVNGLPEGEYIVRNIISVNDSGSNKLFYCIIEQGDISYVYEISKNNDTDLICKKFSEKNVFGANNLTILNGKVFVNMNGEFEEVK